MSLPGSRNVSGRNGPNDLQEELGSNERERSGVGWGVEVT